MKLAKRQSYSHRTSRLWFTLAWLMLVAGCAMPFSAAQQDFHLLPPGIIKQPATVLLKLDSNQGKTNLQWEAVLNVDAAQISLIILGPLGQRLATLNSDGEHLTVEHDRPIDISLKKLLVELQMIFWPLTTLNADKWNKDWRFEEQKNIRQVYYQQQRIAEIHRHPSSSQWSGKFDYISKISDYRLSIRSSQLDQ